MVNCAVYNVEQRGLNVVYFNVDLNNIRQRWNNVVIFNVDLHNAEQRRNNVVNITIWKKIEIEPWVKDKIFLSFKEYTRLKIFFILPSILGGIYKRVFTET